MTQTVSSNIFLSQKQSVSCWEGKRIEETEIQYDPISVIPLDELIKQETA